MGERIARAYDESGNWMSYGRDYVVHRFSPFKQINTQSIESLGLALWYDFDEIEPVESTPLVVDGRLHARPDDMRQQLDHPIDVIGIRQCHHLLPIRSALKIFRLKIGCVTKYKEGTGGTIGSDFTTVQSSSDD
ncbi:MAG: hypothetical protein KDE14_04440 [Rhodobacteraceae bacterium]|nr:hypothetical protein [Paracoccaceae bacterium]